MDSYLKFLLLTEGEPETFSRNGAWRIEAVDISSGLRREDPMFGDELRKAWRKQPMRSMKRFFFVLVAIFFFFPSNHEAFGLPTVYPTGVTIHQTEFTDPGYTIFVPIKKIGTSVIKLIDMEGNIVHVWDMDPVDIDYIRPLPGGSFMGLSPVQDRLVEIDWDGQIVWDFYPDDEDLHHNFQKLDNGNYLVLAHERRLIPTFSKFEFKYDYYMEMTPEHEVIWRWNSWEHLYEFGFTFESLIYIWHPKVVYLFPDFSHTNSIMALPPNQHENDPAFRRGNILISQRNTNIFFIIDKETGEIVWQIGPDDNPAIGQHDAHMIEEGLPGAGNILIFDNGGAAGYPMKYRGYSKVLEIDPTTKRTVWQYNAFKELRLLSSFHSPYISGAQRLPNGNTLITEGAVGRIFEVTSAGQTVWEYLYANPPEELYKAYRVDSDWPPVPLD